MKALSLLISLLFALFFGIVIGAYFFSTDSQLASMGSVSKQSTSITSCSAQSDQSKKAVKNYSKEEVDFKNHRNNSKAQKALEIESDEESVVEMKVSAINKLVNLSAEEEGELRDHYYQQKNNADYQNTLSDLLGEERTSFIREEQRRSFSKSEQENIEKDLYYYSRKFDFSSEQEKQVNNLLTVIQGEVRESNKRITGEGGAEPIGRELSGREKLRVMMKNIRYGRVMLKERMENILSEDQYRAFVEYENESTDADMELWHGGAEEGAEDDGEEGEHE